MREQLEEVMATLTDREQQVIRMRFGLEDGHPRTLEEVGREFHVTRERIRQIEVQSVAEAAPSQPEQKAKRLLIEKRIKNLHRRFL